MVSTKPPTTTPFISEFLEKEMDLELETQKDLYSVGAFVVGMLTAVGVVYVTWLAVLGLIPMSFMLEKVERAVKLLKRQELGQKHEERIITTLREQFEQRGIEIFHSVPTPSRYLDIFVKFPTKEFFAISVWSLGEGKIGYSEKDGILRFRKKSGGLEKYDNPNLIQELIDQEWDLRKTKRELFGQSSRDSRRRLVKVLLLAHPSQIKQHEEHLYHELNEQKFLLIRAEKGSVYVMTENQLVSFIKAHLTH